MTVSNSTIMNNYAFGGDVGSQAAFDTGGGIYAQHGTLTILGQQDQGQHGILHHERDQHHQLGRRCLDLGYHRVHHPERGYKQQPGIHRQPAWYVSGRRLLHHRR